MRILLDECVPAPVAQLLSDHQVSTVQSQGWSGTTNGALLTLAEAQFDVFVTADQNLIYQQNLTSRKIAVVQLSTNNFDGSKRRLASWSLQCLAAQVAT